VTTHYERLKALPTADARFLNASVGFDLERMAPTFKLHLGVPGSSGAFLVARRLGLDGAVLRRAEELLGDRRAGIEELLIAVAEERRRLDAERAAAETARREAEAARREAEARERAARARETRAREGAHDEAVAAMRRARDTLDELRVKLRKTDLGTPDVVAQARAQLAAVGEEIAARAPAAVPPGGRPAREDDLLPGTAVVVASLGGSRGQVTASPERGRVSVQIGALRTTVSVDDLRLDDRPSPKRSPSTPAVKRRAPAAPPATLAAEGGAELAPGRTSDATLDVRGTRVDDALSEVDRFVDDSLMAHREVLFFIHGHGTGALRDAIREHLKLHAGVSRFRAGQEKEGGDGVTVAWLDV
jgi:DNA mismatch repair protein MutS2